ncbi:MAG: hypothetical protein L0227_07495, partial [Chloroflexi bacterium]|nr:hypothetical protein [Chloroflexota bacterium]
GIEINASCTGNGLGGILETDFELADLSDTTNPLGIAADGRVVFHELGGHGVLYEHVNSANFGFAHSAGDGIAAIDHDPDSQAPDRFLTFPWITAGRRHDRDPAAGWAWAGVQDDAGYGAEQILATSHFRIYRAIGGDSTSVTTRRFAARFMTYLILRAIGTLTPATNPSNASGFVTALLAADLGDWTSEGHFGGAYGKVIRWAFEEQGLFQAAGTSPPITGPGAPPPVDVYIEDGRHGEYGYLANHWSNTSVWNRLAADGGTAHETPIVGVTNYAYVRVRNRGTETATNVQVRGFHCKPSAGLVWPDDWQAMATPQLAGSDLPPNDTGEIIVGPFEWIPSQVGHECMLMIASAAGDASNADLFGAGDSIPEWRLVPHDNNIAQRNVAPVAGGGGFGGLVASFAGRPMWVANALGRKVGVEVEVRLPAFLARRGWRLEVTSAGGRRFTLEPGQEKRLVLRLVPGTEFPRAEVQGLPSAERTIDVLVAEDGILVGGMSYEVDPELESPPVERRERGEA